MMDDKEKGPIRRVQMRERRVNVLSVQDISRKRREERERERERERTRSFICSQAFEGYRGDGGALEPNIRTFVSVTRTNVQLNDT